MERLPGQVLPAVLLVALVGAGPTPPGPKVVPGMSFQMKVYTSTACRQTDMRRFDGYRTLPRTVALRNTSKVKILGVSGGVATRVRLTHDKRHRNRHGPTFVATRGRTAAEGLTVTEHGKPITGDLAHGMWNDVGELMAPPAARALRRRVLAHPGKTYQIPKALLPSFIGDTAFEELVRSAQPTLTKVIEGKAKLRLSFVVQLYRRDPKSVERFARLETVDLATGHTLSVQDMNDDVCDMPLATITHAERLKRNRWARTTGYLARARIYAWHGAASKKGSGTP